MAETMVAKHTPEPWAYADGTVYAVQGDERQARVNEEGRPFIYHTGMIALVYSRNGGSQEANGSLMAAAPDTVKELAALVAKVMAGQRVHTLRVGDGYQVTITDADLEPARALLARIETPMG
jgi:hypothetical protein